MKTIEKIRTLVDAFVASGYDTSKRWALTVEELRNAYVQGHRDFRGANLAGARLDDAWLIGANLAGANLAGANLAGANLAGARLVGANLDGANLAGANLAGARLDDANLTGARLDDANLAGANLAGAKNIIVISDDRITRHTIYIVLGETPMVYVGCKCVMLDKAEILLSHNDVNDRDAAAALLAYIRSQVGAS